MKNTLKTLGILIGIILIFSSCEKIDVPHGTPRCIIKKIRQEKDGMLDKVYKYDFNGEDVYKFCPQINTGNLPIKIPSNNYLTNYIGHHFG